MDADLIYQIVSQWYSTGLLSDSDKPILQAAYTEVTGLTFNASCRKCQWSDIQHALRYHLIKELGYQTMENTNKWMLRPDLGYLQVHGLPYVYINKGSGPENASAKWLTDAVAEEQRKKGGDMLDAIIANPDYKAPAPNPGGGTKPKTPATPAAKKPATKPGTPAVTTTPPVEPTPIVPEPGASVDESADPPTGETNADPDSTTVNPGQSGDPETNTNPSAEAGGTTPDPKVE